MKTRLGFLFALGLIAAAAWAIHVSNPAQQAPAGEQVLKEDLLDARYRATVSKGLEYLAKNQKPDGHWEGDDGVHPVATTALAGLALLLEGPGPGPLRGLAPLTQKKYAANIRKARDWLVARQARRDGLLFSGHESEASRYMEGHGLATLFLAGTLETERNEARHEKLTDVVERAVEYLIKARSTQGGWHHTSRAEGHDFADIASTALQIQALLAATNAGIPIPEEVHNDAQEYLKTALGRREGKSGVKAGVKEGVKAGAGERADLPAALAGRIFRVGSGDDVCQPWLKQCRAEIPVGKGIEFGRDELVHLFFAPAAFVDSTRNEYKGPRAGRGKRQDFAAESDIPWKVDSIWADYREAAFDSMRKSQNEDGSWPKGDGLSVGRVYSTAVWCTILQLERTRHPSMPRIVEIVK